MAIYLYQCQTKDCKHNQVVTEIMKPMSQSDREETCDLCNGHMKKLPPTKTSFSLKGTGWYKTDYGSKS